MRISCIRLQALKWKFIKKHGHKRLMTSFNRSLYHIQGLCKSWEGLSNNIPVESAHVCTSHNLKRLQTGKTWLPKSVANASKRHNLLPQGLHNSRFYSRLFLVPEPGNKWRLVIDLSVLDKCLLVPNFKMGTAEIFGNSVIKGEWLVSIDLKDAFFHVPIHPDSQHWLCFHVDKQTYQFKALPLQFVTTPL